LSVRVVVVTVRDLSEHQTSSRRVLAPGHRIGS